METGPHFKVFQRTWKNGAGADPGFLEGGFRSIKMGFVFNILPDFS